MIYFVEDDNNIRELALYALRHAGIEAEGMRDDEEFRAACARRAPDAVVLDIMLPGVDGVEMLRRIRQTPGIARIPIMMATAKSSELDIVTALDAGADEYIVKPYGMMELVSRARALLRRARDWGGAAEREKLAVGPIEVSVAAREAHAGGVLLPLTMREFDLLAYLMQNAGAVVSREELLRSVWGWDFGGGSRTVDVHVQTLRQKLASAHPGSELLLATVRGVGYCIKSPEQTED